MRSVITTTLACVRCGDDARHELVYAGGLLTGACCQRCGYTERWNIFDRYVMTLRRRVRTKPGRVLRDLRADPMRTAAALPLHIIRKPFDMWQEAKLAFRSRHPFHSRGSRIHGRGLRLSAKDKGTT